MPVDRDALQEVNGEGQSGYDRRASEGKHEVDNLHVRTTCRLLELLPSGNTQSEGTCKSNS
jgi:hypothetical protein